MANELKLNHLTEQGNAHMVDVSEKAETKRIAIAEGFITMQAERSPRYFLIVQRRAM